MTDILLAQTISQIQDCYPVMRQLRPHFTHDTFLAAVKEQSKDGYQLVYASAHGKVVAVAGFRLSRNLAWGKFLYIDDLITDEASRSKGYGKKLLDWLVAEARRQHCAQLHLDSGIQRKDAHRFYQREGLIFSSHHYGRLL